MKMVEDGAQLVEIGLVKNTFGVKKDFGGSLCFGALQQLMALGVEPPWGAEKVV